MSGMIYPGIVLLGLAVYFIWTSRRNPGTDTKQIEKTFESLEPGNVRSSGAVRAATRLRVVKSHKR